MTTLQKAAEVALQTCMGVKKSESVLVVTDNETKEIGDALFDTAKDIASDALMLVMSGQRRHGEEPPKTVAYAMKQFDVILCPTRYSLTHTQAVKSTLASGARIATMGGITKDIFQRSVVVDYKKIETITKKLAAVLSKASKVKISSSSGTDLHFGVKNRKVSIDDGICHKKGCLTNLPAGEVFLPPAPKSTNGMFVIDTLNVCKPQTKVFARNGYVVEVEGDNTFKKNLWKLKNARNIAEFGIGVNDKAIMSGKVLEEEKMLGTCHIAFGSNFTFGGTVKADIHWDSILLRPTIYFDNEKIMDSGELLI